MSGVLTPDQIRAASQQLGAQGVPPTRTNIAEQAAVGLGAFAPPINPGRVGARIDAGVAGQPNPNVLPAAAPAAPAAVRGGPQVSPEMMERIKARQEERNRAVIQEAMRARGIKPPAGFGAKPVGSR